MDNVLIKILYGPYEANGVIRHKIQRIYGLTKYLEQKNYRFETHPSPCLNRLTIKMDDRVIYTCDIRFLQFNILPQDDILCQRIISEIEQHHALFSKASNVPNFQNVTEGMRYQLKNQPGDIEGMVYSVDFISLHSAPDYHIIATEEEHDYSKTIKQALQQWDKQVYTYDYGCYMQEPVEQETSETPEAMAESETTVDTITSCVCLSLDPPSLYSVCYGPATPLNTEITQNKSELKDVDVKSRNLNDQAEQAFKMPEFKEIYPIRPSSDTVRDMDVFDSLNETEDEIVAFPSVTKPHELSEIKPTQKYRTEIIDVDLDINREGYNDESFSLYDQNISDTSRTDDLLKHLESRSENQKKIRTARKSKTTVTSVYHLCSAYVGKKCTTYLKK